MLPSYQDIIDLAGEPDWWDQNGAPRYGQFHPNKITVYGNKAALYLIDCQGCDRKFLVAHAYKEWSSWPQIVIPAEYGGPPNVDAAEDPEAWKKYREDFEAQQVPENFHYGDPPNHGCVGDTMSSGAIACAQWWQRENFEWERIFEHEGDLGAYAEIVEDLPLEPGTQI